MSASYTYILDTGVVAIDTVDLLTDVQTEWQQAFGTALNLDASTAQGTMIGAETTARTSVMRNNAELANMMNPNQAYGTFLDAVCSLLGIQRGQNTSTVVTGAVITGTTGTLIPAGSRISTPNGDVFDLVTAVTIPASGSTVGSFQSEAYGSIPFPTGDMTIIDGVIGWGSASCTSSTTVVAGTTQSTDPQLKNRRNKQLAIQGTASASAVYANLLQVPNVTGVMVVENNTGSVGTVNGVTFTKGSALWVCVDGTASTAAIAAAMYAAHNGGCPWDYGASGMGVPVNSPTGVTVNDPTTGLPYQVLYTTPILYDAYVNVTVKQNAAQSPGATAIAQAIMNYASGLEDGEPGLLIGTSLSAFEVSGSIVRQYPGLYVKACQVACVPAGNPAPTFPADYSYEWVAGTFQRAVLKIGNITVQLP